ncbi:MAG: hypothetical protein IJB72_05375 [Clostridia bacterium]|nr:hypothetical protein [Clostridia bacterium]
MSRNKENSGTKKLSLSALIADNRVVFAFSLVVAVVFWCFISMSQTTEIEKEFKDIKVSINIDESLPNSNGLEIFGTKEFFVDVTVKGLSYLVNDSSFSAENIIVSASCSNVTAAGTHVLQLVPSLKGAAAGIEIVNISESSIKVYFDERVTKTFALVEDVEELEGYSLEEGLIRENATLNVESLDISGPAQEIAKITSVKAHAVLSEKISSTVQLNAEILFESSSRTLDASMFTIENDQQVTIRIPVVQIGTFKTAVDFIGMPKDYITSGIEYTVNPAEIDLSVVTDIGNNQINDSNEYLIGIINFNQINNTRNRIVLVDSNLTNYTVTIDMSSMQKRWLTVPVDASSVDVPDGVTILSTSVASVQVVGPASSVMGLDGSDAYAVPEFKKSDLTKGIHTVPAKIVLRTLTDSWVYGNYTIEVEVK